MKLEMAAIVLQPIEEPRKCWDKSLKKMRKNGDDLLLMGDVFDEKNFVEERNKTKSEPLSKRVLLRF